MRRRSHRKVIGAEIEIAFAPKGMLFTGKAGMMASQQFYSLLLIILDRGLQ